MTALENEIKKGFPKGLINTSLNWQGDCKAHKMAHREKLHNKWLNNIYIEDTRYLSYKLYKLTAGYLAHSRRYYRTCMYGGKSGDNSQSGKVQEEGA